MKNLLILFSRQIWSENFSSLFKRINTRGSFEAGRITFVSIIIGVLTTLGQGAIAQAPRQFGFQGFVGMKTDNQVGFYLNGAWRMWANDQGQVITPGGVLQVSDQRLKKNTVAVTESISKLKGLTGYYYYWIDAKQDQRKQTGLIAQETEKYFPELVVTAKDGYKAVNYIGLIPHLIEAIKELDKKTEEIADLKKELASVREMNKKLSTLEASVKELLAGQERFSNQTGK
ncbi:tail fiber domain-containing protein [Dyadobacter sp. 676]|uniref:Tail fiber domain-containing protein n=1 Tax=Dyadobacter sp. 676 TaxID=3088362 RepID=A0AAU8FE56_9BACT